MEFICGVLRDAVSVCAQHVASLGHPLLSVHLWSPSGRRFYIGISEDPAKRLEQHNGEERLGWTHRHRPWALVHSERHDSYTDARRRERHLKRQKGGTGFFAMTGLDPANFRSGP